MANEITMSVALAASKGGVSVTGSKSNTFTLAGSNMISNVQTLSTTTPVAVNVGSCTQIQYMMIVNMDASATVTIGTTSASPPTGGVQVIPAGGAVLLAGSALTYYAYASAGCDINVVAVES